MEPFDPYETCIYDKVHRVRRSRMLFHLTVCSKNFPASNFMQCPFNVFHKVKRTEFKNHIKYCSAKTSVIDDAIYDTKLQTEPNILPIDVNPVDTSNTEKWMDDNFTSYNPLQAVQNKPIVYPIIGLSKAKRRKHRMQERMRFNKIMENNQYQDINQSSIQSDSLEDKPLRIPYQIIKKTNGAPLTKNQISLPSKEDIDDSIIDKLSRTFEEIIINDEDYKKKTEQLDEEINRLKRIPIEKKMKK
ncbi:protein D7-like isoform X2 [Phymastichus coffea]|uniref:protein D7-like isoform X2 n=1 Tax=Phymastichus coffea TaxID=108790 RepID=UPI00273CCED1|nr:protein D7-like isoform X2 [Phymastichus coffea]